MLLLAAALIQATTPPAPPAPAAPAAPAQSTTPPPEFIATAQAYGQCIGRAAQASPATVTPEAAAKQAVAGCATQRSQMDTRFAAWVASPSFPEASRAEANQQYAAQLAGVEAQVASGIRQARAQAAAVPAVPTPAPTPAPAPAPRR